MSNRFERKSQNGIVREIDKMRVYEFGEDLISTNDLDPVYVVLQECGMSLKLLRRWLVAYFCFYHSGTASLLCESGNRYWSHMLKASSDNSYPRSSERRHFRGKFSSLFVTNLKELGIDNLFFSMKSYNRAVELIRYLKSLYGFGSWISFKIADILERLGIQQLSFEGITNKELFESPLRASELLWKIEGTGCKPLDTFRWAVENILEKIGHIKAPPRYERMINIQEAETILCKWGSYFKGNYFIGEDITHLRKALGRFENCGTCCKLINSGIRSNLWTQ